MAAAVAPSLRVAPRNREASTAKTGTREAEGVDVNDQAQPASSPSSEKAAEKKRQTRASTTSSATHMPMAVEVSSSSSLSNTLETLQSEENHSQPKIDQASQEDGQGERRDQGDESTTITKREAPRRRESTRARKPSSRLLPSPSPPPPRSSSYYNFMKNSGQPAQSGSLTSPSPTSSAPAGSKKAGQVPSAAQRASPALSNTAGDGSMASDAGTGPGKRKRRPSTMTKPPATITEALGSAMPASGAAAPSQSAKASKGRPSSIKSATPEAREERGTSVPPAAKAARKLKITATSKAALPPVGGSSALAQSGYDSDGNTEGALLMAMADDGDDSDAGTAEASKNLVGKGNGGRTIKLSTSASRSAHGNTLTVSAMRAAALASASSSPALEPPPLISRRGGMKGSMAVHRQPSTKGTSTHLNPVTPPNSDRWSWHRSAMSVPLLRFKLDNLTSRGDDEESSAAEDDDDDFHVAMLDGANFDGVSDVEDDAPGAVSSAKSSPRASKSYDGSDIEDTPATTPQSPQSTCDLPERRASDAEEESQQQAETLQQTPPTLEQSNVAGGKHVVRDTVFAHALEPSSTRPHTHAGALTLSLPFNEMPQPSDDDPSTSMRPGTESSLQVVNVVSAASQRPVVKQEEQHHDAPSAGGDVDDKDDAGMEAEILGPVTVASTLDSARQATAMMLSSPNPGSAFASPVLTTQTLVNSGLGGKAEPMPLTLPPPVLSRNEAGKARTKLKNATRFDSAHSSDEDEHDVSDEDEEHAFSQATLAMGPPESLCLSELERAWEQSEYLCQARKLATSSAPSPTSDGNSEDDVEQLPLLEVDNTPHARNDASTHQPSRKRNAEATSAKEAAVAAAAARPTKKARTPPSATKVTRSALQQQQASPSTRKARGTRATGTTRRP